MTDYPEILPLEIPELNKKLYLPLCLEKLDQRQYIAFFGLMYQMEQKQISYAEFAPLCVAALLDLKKGKRKISEEELEEAMSNIAMLAEYISAFFNRNENVISLKLQYSKNYIDFVTLPFNKKYFGPSQWFRDVDFGEYEDGLNRFLQYNETPCRELLQELMATFYREKRNGKRYGYLSSEIESAAHSFSNVPIGALYGFYYNFAMFHTYFSSSQVYYNGKLIDLSILFTNQPADDTSTYESPYPSLGIKSTGIEIAKTGVLGNLAQVRSTRLWDVALLLYDMRKKDLDEREKQKLAKKET
ncbi:MAG TPA: hypothetical protein PKH16_10005 [Aequorivita sp.]|nr:hypothetical protein [Aequorivita sp.]